MIQINVFLSKVIEEIITASVRRENEFCHSHKGRKLEITKDL